MTNRKEFRIIRMKNTHTPEPWETPKRVYHVVSNLSGGAEFVTAMSIFMEETLANRKHIVAGHVKGNIGFDIGVCDTWLVNNIWSMKSGEKRNYVFHGIENGYCGVSQLTDFSKAA